MSRLDSARRRSLLKFQASQSSRSGATSSTVGTNLALRIPASLPAVTGPVRRTRCAPMTKAQRSQDGSGKTSLWAASPYYRDAVGNDPRWSA